MPDKNMAMLVKFRKLTRVDDFDDLTFDEAVDLARKARALRQDIQALLMTSYGEYVARLSMAKAVERGDLREFAEQAHINYASLRTWRSKYLEAGEKRGYETVLEEDMGIVNGVDNSPPHSETVVIEPAFVDMFDGTERKASELNDVIPVDDTSVSKKRFAKAKFEEIIYQGDAGILSITVRFRDGEKWERRY